MFFSKTFVLCSLVHKHHVAPGCNFKFLDCYGPRGNNLFCLVQPNTTWFSPPQPLAISEDVVLGEWRPTRRPSRISQKYTRLGELFDVSNTGSLRSQQVELGEALTARTEALCALFVAAHWSNSNAQFLATFRELGPPDLCHVVKTTGRNGQRDVSGLLCKG